MKFSTSFSALIVTMIMLAPPAFADLSKEEIATSTATETATAHSVDQLDVVDKDTTIVSEKDPNTVAVYSPEAVAPLTVQEAEDAVELPSWVAPTILWLQGVPKIGPILVEVLKWLGVVAAALTAISAFLFALSNAVRGIAKAAGFVAFADKSKIFFDKLLKYTVFLSMFNAREVQAKTVSSSKKK